MAEISTFVTSLHWSQHPQGLQKKQHGQSLTKKLKKKMVGRTTSVSMSVRSPLNSLSLLFYLPLEVYSHSH